MNLLFPSFLHPPEHPHPPFSFGRSLSPSLFLSLPTALCWQLQPVCFFFFVSVLESKLQVATKESSVEIADGADTAIECKIVFAPNNSQFTITWYVLPPSPADATPLQIVRANYSSILEYGAEFSSPAQKSRFLSQRVSSNVFWLRILSANPGDQGRYYCVVEEWLWLVDSWYKLGEGASGRTTLDFKLPGEQVVISCICSAREGWISYNGAPDRPLLSCQGLGEAAAPALDVRFRDAGGVSAPQKEKGI